MINLPVTSKFFRWDDGEIITIDFDRSVDFNPNDYPELTEIGHWIISDDLSKFYLVHKDRAEFPDRVINQILGDLNLNGYELIHSGATYA
ncbi:hypothetical protein [Companilactobacillus halodurans]|uniref:Uncharacterized protein n=1 Tax=Companilactobacillus halodurans TaxID=2584183 RepID=A0A5P0ZQ53_9LACO|nr:hypothetical protein [Companilactobacillus halodurans]MQS75991.1 hypothetical protein [Companilactobacillus halodurans]MQS96426.1 hypothetical protein [Companilactobacillus halodurans]